MSKSFVYDNKELADFLSQEYFPKYFDYDAGGVLVPKTYYYQKMYSDSNAFTSWCCLDPVILDPLLKQQFQKVGLDTFDVTCRIIQFSFSQSKIITRTVTSDDGKQNCGIVMNLSDTECSFQMYEPRNSNIREHRVTSILNGAHKNDLRMGDTILLNRNQLNVVDFKPYKELTTKTVSTCMFFNFKMKTLQEMKNLLLRSN